jgi:hypothetical protein
MNYENTQKWLKNQAWIATDKLEKEIVAIYTDLNDRIQADLLKIYKKYDLPKMVDGVPNGEATIAFMHGKISVGDRGRISRLQAEQESIAASMRSALVRKDKLIEKAAIEMYQNGYYWNAWATTNAAGIDIAWPLIDDQMIKKAVYDNPFSVFQIGTGPRPDLSALSKVYKLKWDRTLALQRVTRELELAAGRGDSIQQLGKRLDIIFGFRDPSTGKIIKGLNKKGETYKSIRVARTELHRLFETGHRDEYYEAQDNGVETRLQYVATLDQRTRPQSASMDGQISDAEGRFQYPDGNWYYLGNTGHPEWDISDRCTSIQQIDSITPPLRRIKKRGIVFYETYDEWIETMNSEDIPRTL